MRDNRAYLDNQPVKLWGLRCGNALLSPAVTERLVNNLDNMAAHGINLISVSMQGTNGGYPDVNAGPNAYTSCGKVIPAFRQRLVWLIREADKRGMVVNLVLLMPRKDELLKDEAAIKFAFEETARILEEEQLRNVFVNLSQEFNHGTRADHEIFREPDGANKKVQLTRWFKDVAPHIETGICPNHQTGSDVDDPGCEVFFFQEDMPIPPKGFAVNTETADRDASGNEGVFNQYHLQSMRNEWESDLDQPRLAMLFRSPYVEDVREVQGTGPNFEQADNGTSDKQRGISPDYDWLKSNVGRWEYPRHIR